MPIAEINLSAIQANIEAVRSHVKKGTLIMPALKANAYGHGAVQVAGALEAAGVNWLAVATPEELLELREHGVSTNLLLLTPVLERAHELTAADAALGLHDYATLERLIDWGMPAGTRLHLKVDTGMGRLGLPPEQVAGLAVQAERAGFVIEGVWTHFASAETDRVFTLLQLERFMDAISLLQLHGIEPRLRHACNSAAILSYPEAHLDMVRPGLITYGYSPLTAAHEVGDRLRPALELRAPVTQSKRIMPGDGISYGHKWKATEATNIASIRMGYADGYHWQLSNKGWAWAHGQRLPVRGQVAMDQILVDTGDMTLTPGEQVTIMGGQGPAASELGSLVSTNAYDMLTSLGRRVTRQYISD